jgi:hypothetical protein
LDRPWSYALLTRSPLHWIIIAILTALIVGCILSIAPFFMGDRLPR